MNWLSDFIVFTYKIHTNIQTFLDFKDLNGDDIYMGTL